MQLVSRGSETSADDPYTQFVIAIIRQAVSDASGVVRVKHPNRTTEKTDQEMVRREAQDFLDDRYGVLSELLDLMNVDSFPIQQHLLAAVIERRAKKLRPI